jgi:hypothetical protein
VIPGDGREGIHMNMGRVGEERGGKETDRCPLTIFMCVVSRKRRLAIDQHRSRLTHTVCSCSIDNCR